MKISIITPSYNQAAYLRTCLNSVACQNYNNSEHIVVDGGSNDGSIEVLCDFQKNNLRMRFTSGPDIGQGDAVLVMGVRGLPRLEGDRHHYTEDEVAKATFKFTVYSVV